jgi:uncharacterized membrane protein
MKYRMVAAMLSLVGVLVAAYLYLYKIGLIGTLACGTGGCEAVQLSPYSRFLGIDVALIGIGGYGVLLGLSLLTLHAGPARGPAHWLLALSAVGLGFTLYLTYLELFVIHAICRWCVTSAFLITAIFGSALLERRAFLRGGRLAP